jgi:hypothetical protein
VVRSADDVAPATRQASISRVILGATRGGTALDFRSVRTPAQCSR